MRKGLQVWGSLIMIACALGSVRAADNPELRALGRQVNAAFRALDNLSLPDNLTEIDAKLKEADGLIEKVRAMDPNYAEIRIWENKSRGWKKQIEMVKPSAGGASSGGASSGGASSGGAAPPAGQPTATKGAPAAGGLTKEQVKADWQAFLDYHDAFYKKFDEVFNHNGQVKFYDKASMDALLPKLELLRKVDVPEARQRLDEFGAKYGRDTDTIDRKLFELTPDNPRKSRLDPENQRPDGSAGGDYRDLERMLKLIAEGPVTQAADILKQVQLELNNTAQKSDSMLARAADQLDAAHRLDPNNAAVNDQLAAIQKQRAGIKAAAADQLKTAKFPPNASSFAGPGSVGTLTAAALRYFNEVYPKEKAIAASVAGNWVSCKKNVLGQTIQWGLPVYIASIQNNSKEVCRVFKMTVLAAEGNNPPKAPPFVDHWTGDSYQMLIANVPK
jgi:hypothetical protein